MAIYSTSTSLKLHVPLHTDLCEKKKKQLVITIPLN